MNADGSNQTRLTHLYANGTWWPWWFPDGKKLAFSTDSGGKSGIFTINIDGSKLMRLTDSDNSGYNWAPTVSPDGAKIAFVSDRAGNADVFTMNPDGSHQRDISNNPGLENGNGGIAWTPDNNKLLYIGQAHQVVDEDTSHIIGIASFLLQSAIFMGLALLLLSRWMLPLGSFTLIVTLSSALLSVLNDQYPLVVTAVAAGLLIDALVWWLKPSRSRVVEFRIVAFLLPVIFFSLYYLGLFYTQGVGWSIHLWMGSIVLSGVVGLLLSYLVLQVPSSGEEQA
jgi:hypothetical protein